MPFTSLKLHPSLLKSTKELGFVRPTPIQADAIPPALAGQDVLACAMTGSGKTVAFLLPVLQRLLDKPRGTTRALVLTPTRELAAQILEDLNDLAVHTPITGAAVFGGVGMGPQEHAFRSGADVIIATPGRLMDHFRYPYAKLAGLEILVLDEADRMLDMGFLPEIRKILHHLPAPAKRQTLFFSATMPDSDQGADPGHAAEPGQHQPRAAVGAGGGDHPRGLSGAAGAEAGALSRRCSSGARCARRWSSPEPSTARIVSRNSWCGTASGRRRFTAIARSRSGPQALAGFKDGKYRVLVATDIAARGIDIDALGHVVNFNVPAVPDDYIHRVGRTGRADAVGDAFTFVAPEEEDDLRRIERAIGKRLPRVTVPDFDYTAVPEPQVQSPAQRPATSHAPRDGARRGGSTRRGPAPKGRRPHGR